jgi:LacI family transcriptional regulator
MSRPRKRVSRRAPGLERITRPVPLTAQVEQLLRRAIAEDRWADGRLPTEVELAEQLGVSRETVRLAAEALQREGLLVKVRRRGTFARPPQGALELKPVASTLLAYLQADFQAAAPWREEAVTRAMSALLLQGAIEEAGRAGFTLVVQHAPPTQLGDAFQQLHQHSRLRGVIFASYGEEKFLRRAAGLGLPTVLLDHDLHVPQINSLRDDSFEGARQAVLHLAGLGHRRVAFALWHETDLNPWRLRGYRQGLRDAGLPRRRCWEIPAALTEAGARTVVDQWLRLAPRPTAVYCFNNTLARFVHAELLRRGVNVPGDVSVLGGGGEEVLGLTCQQADWDQMGRTAVQILLRALADPDGHTPEHVLSPLSLRVGRTAAAPPE